MKIVLATMAGKGTTFEQLGRAFDSAREYVDDIYLLDTGLEDSVSDRVIEVYEQVVAIESEPWTNNFGQMRNSLLEGAAEFFFTDDMSRPNYTDDTSGWILMLDSDESIACSMLPNDFRQLLQQHLDDPAKPEALYIQHHSNLYGQPRIFRVPVIGKFEGKTHEAYVCPNGNYPNIAGMKFVDYDRPAEVWQAKFLRDLEILKTDIISEPSARKYFYLGETYRNLGDHLNSAKHYLECVKTSSWNEERAWASYRCAVELTECGDLVKALQVVIAGLEFMPAMVELPWYAGYLCSRLGRHGEAVCWGLMARALNDRTIEGIDEPQRVLFKHLPAFKTGPWDVLRWGYRAIGMGERADYAENMWQALQK